MKAGALRHLVELDDPVEDRTPVVFSPAQVFADIQPAPPSAFDELKVTHLVRIRYHEQVTFNTRLTHRGRRLYVRGIQNVGERNRELVLQCEEVVTP